MEDTANLTLLVALFNGNLVFPLKQISFARFLNAFNHRFKAVNVSLINTLCIPNVNDYWLY